MSYSGQYAENPTWQGQWIGWPLVRLVASLYDKSITDEVRIEMMCHAINKLYARIDGFLTIEEWNAWLIQYEKDQADQTEEIKDFARDLVAALKQYSDEEDEKIRAELSAAIVYLEGLIEQSKHDPSEIFDPTYGKPRSTEKVVERVYDFDRYFAITALQHDSRNETAKTFDARGLEAWYYDTRAELKMIDYRKHSPVSGRRISLYEMIVELSNLHRASWNAAGFDSRGYTVEQYEAFNWSAFYHDFYNYIGADTDARYLVKHNVTVNDFQED